MTDILYLERDEETSYLKTVYWEGTLLELFNVLSFNKIYAEKVILFWLRFDYNTLHVHLYKLVISKTTVCSPLYTWSFRQSRNPFEIIGHFRNLRIFKEWLRHERNKTFECMIKICNKYVKQIINFIIYTHYRTWPWIM